MLDAAPNLRLLIPGITVDAAVSRHVASGITAMRARAAAGSLGHNVVVALGTNGTFTVSELDQMVSIAAGRHLVLVTNHCPYCSWVAGNNGVIAEGCTAARNCSVADWNSVANANPGWFGSDGVHMPIGGAGGQAYAELITRDL